MTVFPVDENDIPAARALRMEFMRFWSTARGEPRDIYDRFIAATPAAAGVVMREASDGPGPGWWCEPADVDAGHAILYLHGGGYAVGHAGPYTGFVSQIAVRARARAFILEYPLAPETPVGAALELALATLARLTSTFAPVAIVGDSAGGGLSLATALEAHRRGIPVSALAVFSPWTDLTLSGQSMRDQAVGDLLLDPTYLRACATGYLGTAAATDPRASPLFDKDMHLPPTLIQVGMDEVLLDDSRRFAEKAMAAGSNMVLEEWQGMHHVFQLNVEQLDAARQALDRAAAFLSAHA